MARLEALRGLRTDAGISQNALATAISRSHTYVWNVEAGRVKLTARDTIGAWAEALGVHPDEVYKAIGTVPHDIIEQLQEADLETWQTVRSLIVDSDSEDYAPGDHVRYRDPGLSAWPADQEDATQLRNL
jgi:transcriptional regulator with XRE-family HTH domain